mgnify:CR=1 FL=1
MSYSTIILFRSRYGQSRLWEFQAVAEYLYPNHSFQWGWNETAQLYYGGDYGPSIVQKLPDSLTAEQWSDVAVRCIGCKSVFQVVGEGVTLADCIADVGRWSDHDILKLVPDTWSMQIEHLGKMQRLHPKERRIQIEQFRDVLGILTTRKVDLESPDTELVLLKDCRSLEDIDPSTDRQATHYHWLLKRIKATKYPSAKILFERSDVKKRAFISTTTMPADRALLMANLAGVQQGNVVLDPFCGSGGLLIASALLGASTVGADIDDALLSFTDRVLPFPHSPHRPKRGVERVSYGDSFLELGLDEPILLPGLDIQSASFVSRVLQANDGQKYDAIVTDPPYGIRESTSQMSNLELVGVLAKVAQSVLKPSGRLVFLQVIKGDSDNVEHRRLALYEELQPILQTYRLDLKHLVLEKFNTQNLRATVVVEKQG